MSSRLNRLPAARPAPSVAAACRGRRHFSCSPPSLLSSSTSSAPANTPDRLSYDSATAYCRGLVAKHDHEHYLASLFLPPTKRPIAWGLRAFNLELANVRESVRDDTLGRMRFQFWRDTIDNIHRGHTPNHPVAVMLAAGVHEFGLSAHRLKRVVKGREDNFLTRQYPSIAAIEDYAESTASTLMYLHLELQGVKSLEIDHIASHLGKAATMATLLRGTPFHLRSRLFYLPADVCAQHGVVAENVMRHGPSEELSSAVFDLATRANDHIITARTHVEKDGTQVKGPAMAALLPVVPTYRWLKRLEKVDFDLFQGTLHQRDPWLPAYLWWANRTGKF